MEASNRSSPVRFILLGLSSEPPLQVVLFVVFLGVYLVTLCGNLLLITVVRITPKLQTPMYFFLTNLSIIDLSFSSTVVPVLLHNTLSMDRSIGMVGCAAQMFFSLVLGVTECLLLIVMAYDRYAAICKPLRYHAIMSTKLCVGFTLTAWGGGVINATFHVILTFQLPYCRSHHVKNFFCEVPSFLRMSCREPRLNEVAMFISAVFIVVCAFLLILISYVHIASTILKIRSSEGRKKAFSTCASHLTVVTLYYGTLSFIYLQPGSSFSPDVDKVVSIAYTVITPMLNPIIYSIRNKDVMGVVMAFPIRHCITLIVTRQQVTILEFKAPQRLFQQIPK